MEREMTVLKLTLSTASLAGWCINRQVRSSVHLRQGKANVPQNCTENYFAQNLELPYYYHWWPWLVFFVKVPLNCQIFLTVHVEEQNSNVAYCCGQVRCSWPQLICCKFEIILNLNACFYLWWSHSFDQWDIWYFPTGRVGAWRVRPCKSTPQSVDSLVSPHPSCSRQDGVKHSSSCWGSHISKHLFGTEDIKAITTIQT